MYKTKIIISTVHSDYMGHGLMETNSKADLFSDKRDNAPFNRGKYMKYFLELFQSINVIFYYLSMQLKRRIIYKNDIV